MAIIYICEKPSQAITIANVIGITWAKNKSKEMIEKKGGLSNGVD